MGNTASVQSSNDNYSTATNVPVGTIKKGYDVFEHGNWGNLLNNQWAHRNGKYDNDCNPTYKDANVGKNETLKYKDIINPQGRWRKGEHRGTWCTNFWGNKDCGNCELAKEDKDARDKAPGKLSSAKVPIGLKAYFKTGNASGNCDHGQWCCHGHNADIVGYNYGNYRDQSKWPKRMHNDVAIGCSGGWYKGGNEFETSLSKDVWNNNSKKSKECWVGPSTFRSNDDIVCIYGDVEPAAYCQMGDYVVSTDICKKQCEDTTIAPDKLGNGAKGKEYCRYALDRYCGTIPGEAYKKDAYGNIVKMGTGKYPLLDNPKCIEYCVGANTSNCHSNKRKVCTSRLGDWLTNDKLVDYCKSYWFNNLDKPFMSNAYKKELMNSSSPQNVMSEKGLGKLCDAEGTNVDDMWCKEMKKAYCTANDANMLTDKCYEFCADPDNADQCDDYVKNMCRTRLNIEDEEGMLKSPPGSKNSYGSWCGCMMTDAFYRKARDAKLARFDELGYDIRGETDLSPECEYPYCKEGAIKTKSQQGRLTNDECKDCVQTMLTSLDNSTFVNSDVQQAAKSNCGKIIDRSKIPVLPPGVYNMKATDKKYRLDSDKTYCAYDNEEVLQKDLDQHYNNLYKTIEEWPTSEYVERKNPCNPLPKPSAFSSSSVLSAFSKAPEERNEEENGIVSGISIAIIFGIALLIIGVVLVWAKKNKRWPFSDKVDSSVQQSVFGRRRYRRSH